MAILYENGSTISAVVYSINQDPVTNNAVSEFCLFSKKCSGNDHPSFPEIPEGYKTLIFIHPEDSYLEKYGIKIPKEKFDDDTVYYRVKGNIVIIDGGIRGKLYAVYEFLEKYLNVRFYSKNACRTPRIKDLAIEDVEYIYTPKIKYRNLYGPDTRFDVFFSVRTRNNDYGYTICKANFGGGLKWASPSAHTTFEILIPPEDPENGFAKHPEYYSYIAKQGKRVGRHHNDWGFPWGEGEVCWTNKDAIDVMFKNLQRWILEKKDKEIFSISQNDWANPCECEECKAFAHAHGDRLSAPIINAVNILARRVKEWQKVDDRVRNRTIYLETFAYQYGTMPPVGMTVEDNVIIRLCTHENCFYHAIDDETCPVNRQFLTALKGWQKIAKNIYVWDYLNNFCMDIAFNTILRNVRRNDQLFAKNNVIGVFAEYQDSHYFNSGLYPEVRTYLYSMLLWNPDMDYEKEYKDCFEFFYGKSAKYIMAIEDAFNENCDKLEMFHPELAYMIYKDHYSDEFMAKADELFKKALEVAENIDIEVRIRKDYECLKYTKMYFTKGENKKEMDDVLAECKYLGVTYSKMNWFIDHFYNNKPNDLFKPEIEKRNKENELKKIMEVLK